MKHWRMSNADVLAVVKAVLATHWGCSEAEAYSRLQRIAELKKRKLRAMARDVFVAYHGLERLLECKKLDEQAAAALGPEPEKRRP